jgi:hypothetical protein
MPDNSNRHEIPHSHAVFSQRYTPPSVALAAFLHNAQILFWSGFNLWWAPWLS